MSKITIACRQNWIEPGNKRSLINVVSCLYFFIGMTMKQVLIRSGDDFTSKLL